MFQGWRSIFTQDLLVQCGGDHLSAPFAWPRLEYGDFSYNGIEQLDDSLVCLSAIFMVVYTTYVAHINFVHQLYYSYSSCGKPSCIFHDKKRVSIVDPICSLYIQCNSESLLGWLASACLSVFFL